MFDIFRAVLVTVEQAPWGRNVQQCTPFAPYLTSSLCPPDNGVVIGFPSRGAPKPCGPAQEESRRGGER
ncbi:hypothetical protein CesoFtcFv8_007051 [Champsocephalus esox]|uniref:Uncharacterized protein n=1 Tax=Champsocephalus esox TaxID=159716 RepID=A0AAN8CD56_9TELE|nr:hypothetical protein CesoFtcFv8_007051 [Champsocephalus esox]